jgi:futalosine hydrolase
VVSILLLVPTQFELDCLSVPFREQLQSSGVVIELCGFGAVISAIRTTQLIALHRPKKVWLAGLAGSLTPELSIGQAVEFDEAICYGIGAGSSDEFVAASAMGWKQWPSSPEISDSIQLTASAGSENGRSLLSCCAVSSNESDVRARLHKYPTTFAEDMEGFSVAASCLFAGVPLRIVRGISNRAGDRDKKNWNVSQAMKSVERYLAEEFSL